MAEVHHTEDCGDERDYQFRYIRSSKIQFSVKAERDVAICLSQHDHKESDMYQIFIGCWGGGESGIRRGREDDVVKVETPDILSADEFTAFWIKVNNGIVKVGKKGKLRPFMTFEDPERLDDIKFYGYCTGYGAEGDWIFNDEKEGSSSSSSSGASSSDSEAEDLDGLEEKPIMYKRIARWVPGHGGYLPRHPVCGGEGPDGLVYVGMAKHEGGHILGMVVPDENVCYIPFGGEAIPKEEYYVLGSPNSVELVWKGSSSGKVPTGALEGGHTEDGEVLYIGRVMVDGIVSCGKVHPSHGVCYVPYGGAEHAHRDYEVLCVKGLPFRVRL
ncbi:UNVERIFIED_CONTAM: hypothetical protein RMT77_013195 [Armadillidium vulgare]